MRETYFYLLEIFRAVNTAQHLLTPLTMCTDFIYISGCLNIKAYSVITRFFFGTIKYTFRVNYDVNRANLRLNYNNFISISLSTGI